MNTEQIEYTEHTEEQTAAAVAAFDHLIKCLTNGQCHFSTHRLHGEHEACNSRGVQATWDDKVVRVARLTRDAVQVTGPDGEVEVHTSVREAFRACRLPDTRHIRFRLDLKKKREMEFEWGGRAYRFKLVPAA